MRNPRRFLRRTWIFSHNRHRSDQPRNYRGWQTELISGLTGGDGIDLDAAQTVAVPIIGMTGRIMTVTDESHTVANDIAAIITLPGNYVVQHSRSGPRKRFTQRASKTNYSQRCRSDATSQIAASDCVKCSDNREANGRRKMIPLSWSAN